MAFGNLGRDLLFRDMTGGDSMLAAHSGPCCARSETGLAVAPVEEAPVSGAASAPLEPPMPEALNDDIADDISTTTVLPIGTSISTSIQTNGDRDYFRVTLEAGRTYTFHMDGPAGGLRDPYLEFRDSFGTILSENDDGGVGIDSFLVVRPTVTGVYYVVARAYSGNNFTDTGAYTLTATEIPRGNTSPTPVTETAERPAYSWDEAAIQLTRSGHSWAEGFGQATTVTYGFRATAPGTLPEDADSFARFNTAQIQAAERALKSWADAANITLVRVGTGDSGEGAYTDSAAMLFSNYTTSTTGTAGFAYLPTSGNRTPDNVQGDIWINTSIATNLDPITNPGAYRTLLHEIGHALGLHHPGEYDGGSPTYEGDATYAQDSAQFTGMSYFHPSVTGASMSAWSQVPHLHDIAAIQRLYGANMSTRTGDTVYGFNGTIPISETPYFQPSVSNSLYFTIWDAGGNDTIDASGYSSDSTLDLRQEAFSTAGPIAQGGLAQWNIAIARGAVIENAIGGGGADLLVGNNSVNLLNGNGGSDTFEVRAGDWVSGDTILGGAGFDTLRTMGSNIDYRVGAINSIERIQFQQTAGQATLNAMIDVSQIGAGLAFNLVLSGSAAQDSVQVFVGDNGAVDISGWTFDFPAWFFDDYVVFVGANGNESFTGFQGLDIFFGSPGNDTYNGNGAVDFAAYIFSPFAVVADLAISGPQFIGGNQGSDTFINLEGLAGSQLSDQLFGDHQGNILLGLYGDDILVGRAGDDDLRGAEGSDRIEGGMGADVLWGYSDLTGGPDGGDTFVYRTAAEGGDTIRDFVAGSDLIEISAAGFGGGLAAGQTAQFTSGVNPAASGAGGRFLYNTSNGQLSWDADGAGAGAAVLLATFLGSPALTAASIVVTGLAASAAWNDEPGLAPSLLVSGGAVAGDPDRFDFSGAGAQAWSQSQDYAMPSAIDIAATVEAAYDAHAPDAFMSGAESFDWTNAFAVLGADDLRIA